MLKDQGGPAAAPATGGAEATMVCGMRLLLSVSALLTLFIDPDDLGARRTGAWLVLLAYALHSLALFVLARCGSPYPQQKPVYWLDTLWYALIVYCTGAGNSFFFLFFFFVILTSSFHWGFDQGARITLACAGLFCMATLAVNTQAELPTLLLHTTFLLALGYMIAYWGGLNVAQQGRLALLRDVSHLSNPRFGVDHTIASVLEKTLHFYGAGSCLLLTRDNRPDTWLLRTAMRADTGRSINAERISAETAAPLLEFGAEQIVIYAHAPGPQLPWNRGTYCLERGQAKWARRAGGAGARLADLLEAGDFISAPLPLRKGQGRIYVLSAEHGFSKADALFLSHIAAQAFPAIENIELLDRLASDAALRERQKIARDLHDTAIQPYIGLRHAIGALRKSAGADNPLSDGLDRLEAMTGEVIRDMRHFASKMKNGPARDEPELLMALRRQSAQMKEFYGIEIALEVAPELDINDRLAAEVFQILNEGMSNIRKHTTARHGRVRLARSADWLHIRIDNACQEAPPPFMPASISERCAALGGTLRVVQEEDGATVLLVCIPV